MVTYLGKFIPNLSDVTAPLRELTKKDVVWHWEPEHARAVDSLKNMITSAPVLKLYDATKPVALATDASNAGFGAVLMQDNNPIAYASRRVNDAESNYAPIEKEMCAILFACNRFHDYVYGQRVTIHTDHKPLIGIAAKPITQVEPSSTAHAPTSTGLRHPAPVEAWERDVRTGRLKPLAASEHSARANRASYQSRDRHSRKRYAHVLSQIRAIQERD